MSDELFKTTVRMRSGASIGIDERGRSVCTRPIEDTALELISTATLEILIHAADDGTKDRLRMLSELDDGYLVRNLENNEFELLHDDDLEAALQEINDPHTSAKLAQFKHDRVDETDRDEEPCLVSTQMLRRIIESDADL